MNISVVQMGARRNYIVPRIMHEMGLLNALYTDIYAPKLLSAATKLIASNQKWRLLKRLQTRTASDLDTARVFHNPVLALEYKIRRTIWTDYSSQVRHCNWAGNRIAEWLAECQQLSEADAILGFNSASCELFNIFKGKKKLFLDQTIAPMSYERNLLLRACNDWPNWSIAKDYESESVEKYITREKQEMQLANVVLCGSSFVKQSVENLVPNVKTKIVPYAVQFYENASKLKNYPNSRNLRVLFVGAIGLRKGAPYLLHAASQLSKHMDFRFVGKVDTAIKNLSNYENIIEFTGAVDRASVADHYKWADLLVLPSLCEGSAGVVFEAMSFGVVPLVTHNSGSVITHGEDGLLIDAFSSSAIVEALNELDKDREKLLYLSKNLSKTCRKYDISLYKKNLKDALS